MTNNELALARYEAKKDDLEAFCKLREDDIKQKAIEIAEKEDIDLDEAIGKAESELYNEYRWPE